MNEKEEQINSYESSKNAAEGALRNTEPYFFSTSALKLVLMSVCTFGIYELYWFYKNWTLIRERTEQNIMPFWRAFFAPIWTYSCFRHIESSARENNIQESLSFGALAVFYIILIVAPLRLPDPLWLLSFFTFAPMIPVNRAALRINEKLVADFENNEKFSGWNWVCLILAGILFLLCLMAMFLPEP